MIPLTFTKKCIFFIKIHIEIFCCPDSDCYLCMKPSFVECDPFLQKTLFENRVFLAYFLLKIGSKVLFKISQWYKLVSFKLSTVLYLRFENINCTIVHGTISEFNCTHRSLDTDRYNFPVRIVDSVGGMFGPQYFH